MDELAETIQTSQVTLLTTQDVGRMIPNDKPRAALLDLRSRQFEQIQSELEGGARKPTPQDFTCAFDLAVLLDTRDKGAARKMVDWLLDNAEGGGWVGYREALERSRQRLDEGHSLMFNIYNAILAEPGDPLRYGRRYPSFRGPTPEQRGLVLWGWQDAQELISAYYEKKGLPAANARGKAAVGTKSYEAGRGLSANR